MKTAVEWLVSQILTDIEKYNDDCTAVVGFEYFNKFQSHVDLSEYIKQAKEMEEEQIIEAWEDGFETSDIFEDDGTNYYNNKFKSE